MGYSFLVVTTVVALAFTLVQSTSAASQVAAAVPQLALDGVRHDFGEVFAGEDLMHVFWVRNTGTAPLELSEMPQLGTRPSKVSFAAKVGRAAPS